MATHIKSTPAAVPSLLAGSNPSTTQQDQWLIPDGTSIDSFRRLVVLTPADLVDSQTLVDKAVKIALPHKAQVVFVALNVNRVKNESTHRRLGLMAATARSSVVSYTQMLPAAGWMDALAKIGSPGDIIVMPAGMAAELGTGLAALRLPACLLGNLYPSLGVRILRGVGRRLYEIMPLIIIGGFLWMQIQVSDQTTGTAKMVLTALTVATELGLLIVWSLFLP